ncbi:MAG: cyclase family protein [Gemmataceae bacterium]
MIHDITPLVSHKLQVWPGDTPPRREVLLDMQRGDNITLSTLHATVHLGAHADAPSHYGAAAPTIEQRSLEYYLGPCQVIRVDVPRGAVLRPENIGTAIETERVLIATDSFPDPERFNEDFVALGPDLVDYFHRQGVKTVGVDTPSVDPFESKDLPAHRKFLELDMAILEGLVLRDVLAGRYELIALPLKLGGFDASPVRAILRSL